MPIATCYIQEKFSKQDWEKLVQNWSEEIGVNASDISINVLKDYIAIGENYKLRVDLFLPTIWPEESIARIQSSFIELVDEILDILPKEVFLMTHLVQSGHVVDRGNTIKW